LSKLYFFSHLTNTPIWVKWHDLLTRMHNGANGVNLPEIWLHDIPE